MVVLTQYLHIATRIAYSRILRKVLAIVRPLNCRASNCSIRLNAANCKMIKWRHLSRRGVVVLISVSHFLHK